MNDRIKLFGSFDEISKDKKSELIGFKELNDLLEKDTKITFAEVKASYLKIMLEEDFEKNKFNYSELDFVVKKLIEESSNSVNAILLFLDKKYPKKEALLQETLGEFFIFPDEIVEKIINLIFEKKIGYITLHTGFKEIQIYFDFENFEFNDALRRFKNNLIKELKREEN